MAYPKNAIPNAYPEKPVVAANLMKIDANTVAAYIKSTNYPDAVKQAALFLFAQETTWGRAGGLNNNFAGVQADGDKWGQPWDNLIVATTTWTEGMSKPPNNWRRFAVFADWKYGINFKLATIVRRQLYIGGLPWKISKFFISNEKDFVKAYLQEWVDGDKTGRSLTPKNISDSLSVYKRSGLLLGTNVTKAAQTATSADEKKK